jgi:hypothetical protein
MYHSLLPLAVTSSPSPKSSIDKPMEPSQVRGWLGPRANMGAIPAVNRITCSMFQARSLVTTQATTSRALTDASLPVILFIQI